MNTRATILALCLLLPSLAFARTNAYMLGGSGGTAAGPDIALLGTVATQAACDSVTSCTASHTLSAGTNRKVVAVVAAEDATATFTISGATYNGVAMTQAIQVATPTAQNRIAIFYMDEASLPAPGAYNVVANFDETVSDASVTVYAVENIAQGAPKDTDSSTSDSASNATLALTGVVATDWTFTGATHSLSTGTWTHGGGQQERADFQFGSGSLSASVGVSDEPGEAAPSSTVTGGVARFAMVGATWAKF